MCGSAVVFGTFLWIQPLDLGIFCTQRCSRTRRTQRCTPDLWGKPGGRDNCGTNPPNDSPHGAHQGWCAGRLCSSPGSPEALPGVPRVKDMTRRAFSWQSNAQRVIRRRDPFHGTDLGDLWYPTYRWGWGCEALSFFHEQHTSKIKAGL